MPTTRRGSPDRRAGRRALLAALAALAGCHDASSGIRPPEPPLIEAATVEASAHSVLSALVSVRVRDADSVVAQYRPAAGPTEYATTPAFVPLLDAAEIPVLGLADERTYELRVVAYGPGGRTTGEPLALTTGSLPDDLPRFVAGGTDPSAGFVVFASERYGIVIDNTGRVVWYHGFPKGPGLNFMALANGRYGARPPTEEMSDLEPWVEIGPLGDTTRTLTCARELQPRLHDLLALPDGSYWLLCDETKAMDLSEVGGVAGAQVTGTVVQHIGAGGELLFEWSAFDHFAMTDVDPSERSGENVNWTHGNALDLDDDGHLIVSFRNLGELTKIDSRTGAVLWRMGGRANQFTFPGATMPPFARQHGVRATAGGTLLLLDNTGDPLASRAERYEVDDDARIARLVRSYASTPDVVTQIGGSVQPLPGGRTLVSFGTAGRVEEYDADGRVVWRIEEGAGYVFRAQRIESLYAPGAEGAR